MKFTEWLLLTVVFVALMIVICYAVYGDNIRSLNHIIWITCGWVEGSAVTWYLFKSSTNKKE